jgi:hypothetical protein
MAGDRRHADFSLSRKKYLTNEPKIRYVYCHDAELVTRRHRGAFFGSFSILSSYSDELDLMSNQFSPPMRDTASRAQRQPVKDCNVLEIDLDVGRLTDAELASRLALARARIETSFFNTFRST